MKISICPAAKAERPEEPRAGGSKGGMSGLKRKLPAEIAPETREKIRSLAVKTFQALNCSGVSRIDFMIDMESGGDLRQ